MLLLLFNTDGSIIPTTVSPSVGLVKMGNGLTTYVRMSDERVSTPTMSEKRMTTVTIGEAGDT